MALERHRQQPLPSGQLAVVRILLKREKKDKVKEGQIGIQHLKLVSINSHTISHKDLSFNITVVKVW